MLMPIATTPFLIPQSLLSILDILQPSSPSPPSDPLQDASPIHCHRSNRRKRMSFQERSLHPDSARIDRPLPRGLLSSLVRDRERLPPAQPRCLIFPTRRAINNTQSDINPLPPPLRHSRHTPSREAYEGWTAYLIHYLEQQQHPQYHAKVFVDLQAPWLI